MASQEKSKSNLLGTLAQLSKTVSAPCPIGKIHNTLFPYTTLFRDRKSVV